MMIPKVEFFSEEMDGVEYINIGLQWEKGDGTIVHAVLGALAGELEPDAMKVIAGVAEQACMYVLELDGAPDAIDVASRES